MKCDVVRCISKTQIFLFFRSHIVKLPSERQLEFMHTPYQFLLMSSPPAKEEAFRAAKEKHGSTFCFHGSSIENWHSIIRYVVLYGKENQIHHTIFSSPIRKYREL